MATVSVIKAILECNEDMFYYITVRRMEERGKKKGMEYCEEDCNIILYGGQGVNHKLLQLESCLPNMPGRYRHYFWGRRKRLGSPQP